MGTGFVLDFKLPFGDRSIGPLLLNILSALASQGQRPCRFSAGLAAPHLQYLASGSIESLARRGADRRIKLGSPAIRLAAAGS
jgi:hypothetical protein